MKKILVFLILIGLGALVWHVYARNFRDVPVPMTTENQPAGTIEQKGDNVPKKFVNLEVPYINEAPENIWTGSWKNACEEAVIAMVDDYYRGVKTVSIDQAKQELQALFDWQKKIYGSDANSDTARTLEIIQANSDFEAKIVAAPTVEAIKRELLAGRPVIAFHRGFDLGNKNIPFLPTGSSYHTTVIKGFDDDKGVFVTNDPGDSIAGVDHVYTYDVFMNSLGEYNYRTQQVDLPAKVLFTSPNS